MKRSPQNRNPLEKGSKLLLDFAAKLIEEGILDETSVKKIDNILQEYRGINDEQLNKFMDGLTPVVRNRIKKEYFKYMRGGYLKTNPTVTSYQLKDLAPKYRKQLKDAVDNSLSLIKTQNEKTRLLLEQRFRNWATIPSKELRASLTDKPKMISNLKREIIDEPNQKQETNKHLQFVITDQTRKMIGAMDKITADENGAIGFIWRTRIDNRVVGNPAGLYPEVTDPKAHGNHFKREGVFYLYPDTWAIKKGYVVPRDNVILSSKLDDGIPSVPISCRCTSENIYDLEDIPKKYSGCITKKGEEFMSK